jgi:anaerobic ribonucleoside-triphosphate reductase
MVKAIKQNTQLLLDSMDRMQECTHESNLVIEEKRSKTQESIVDKQLDYFKCRDKIINEIQMIMVNESTSLANIIREILKGDKGKEPLFPKQNFDAHIKEDAQ